MGSRSGCVGLPRSPLTLAARQYRRSPIWWLSWPRALTAAFIAQGFYDYESGFGEGAAFRDGNGVGWAVPRSVDGDHVVAYPLRRRTELAMSPTSRLLLSLPREHRTWLRHQREGTLDVASEPINIQKHAILHPISICAPGVPNSPCPACPSRTMIQPLC